MSILKTLMKIMNNVSNHTPEHPTSRQNFGDAPGQTPKLMMTLCHMAKYLSHVCFPVIVNTLSDVTSRSIWAIFCLLLKALPNYDIWILPYFLFVGNCNTEM